MQPVQFDASQVKDRKARQFVATAGGARGIFADSPAEARAWQWA
ncbi:MAG TPA: hypothetical protein VME44_13720 [Streptosporangiaceae bacterium]|nr:hypothetical protein [Streptosporangiaceae bacterium]